VITALADHSLHSAFWWRTISLDCSVSRRRRRPDVLSAGPETHLVGQMHNAMVSALTEMIYKERHFSPTPPTS